MEHQPYDIGTPGVPWGMSERKAWLDRQRKQRDFHADVEKPIRELAGRFQIVQYGHVDYSVGSWPLLGLRTRHWSADRPTALITGGVHGYETSGVHGALRFVQAHAHTHESRWNLVIAPCVNPWGYETINRWNPDAVDPNRSFLETRSAQEAGLLMDWIADQALAPRLHIDLHETTDTDNTEFRPALAARDGVRPQHGPIPDGFYTVGPSARPALDFQSAVISSVERVTHIADPDPEGRIIGVPVSRPGVILYDARPLGLCMGMTSAPFATTTEVYPDSPRTTPDACVVAQVAAIEGALTHAADRVRPTA